MDPAQIHAKAIIAAALIATRAVETPRRPEGDAHDAAAEIRLRELTDYVYRIISGDPKM